ncbi:MAG: permease [Pedobacter sp.]|nr:MAG: permease [Pedobacter sp.]
MTKKIDVKLLIALSGVAILWGTTYLGIRVAVETIPGWYVTAMRQALAASVLLVMLLYKGELKWHGGAYLFRQLLLSVLMIVIANGMTTLAEKTIPSGLTALINSISPLLVFVGSVAFGYQKPSLKGFIGIVMGLVGIVFLFRNGVSSLWNPEYRTGIIYLLIAITGWSVGTIYSKQSHKRSEGIFHDLFYQFTFSAVIQYILALLFSGDANVGSWSTESLFATGYLAIFGSILGYFCYNYALKKVSASDVSILTYFNTIIALFLGWLILDEVITKDILIAASLIILGVFITNYNKEGAAPEKSVKPGKP